MKQRRALIFVLAVLIVCTTAVFVSAESQVTVIPCQRYVNPLYADVVTQPLLQSSGSRETVVSYCDSLDAVVEVLRSGLEARETEITVGYATRSSYNSSWPMMIFENALEHTGVSTQGDYLRWHYRQCGVSGSRYNMGGVTYITLTYTLDYLSNAWQEQQMDSAVESLLARLNVDNASDYEKIRAVYDYICQNITYAHTGLENGNPMVYTAYAALVNKSAVCQGYASLFYRLMLELDVDTRVIAGVGAGDNHGWNIVRLSDLYYDVDATWDAGERDYRYFLKCDANFDDHLRDAEYATEAFYSQYPMALADYDPSQDTGNESVIDSGKCGDNVKYSLSSDGVMTISGQGKMWNFNDDEPDDYDYHENPWGKLRQDIKTVVFKPGVTYIGACAFKGCENLTHVTFTDSITSIGHFAFIGCTNLENFVLPQELGFLGQQAFDGCIKITKVRIPDTVTFLGGDIFRHCEALTDVYIGGSADVSSYIYANNPLGTCTSLEEIKVAPDNIALTAVGGVLYSKDLTTLVQYPAGKKDKVYTVPATVKVIYKISMWDNPYIEVIYLPNSLEIIDSSAFRSCENLKKVDFSAAQNVTTIGSAAFEGCSSLTSVTIPASVTSIGGWAFYDCDSLTGIWVDADNANYSSDSRGILFNKNQTTLIQVPGVIAGNYRIPDGVTSIGEYAFSNCSLLESVTIPDGVAHIGDYAFLACSLLESVAIPDSVTNVGDYAFLDCSLLQSVTIGNSVTSIGDGAFENCSLLESVRIPDSVTHIGERVFCHCGSLKRVTIPDGVTSIGEFAFASCSLLESVRIPDGVTHIGERAFIGCYLLESVTIPNSVTSIGEWAFAYCGSLRDVYYAGNQDQWNAIRIESGNSVLTDATIHYGQDHPHTFTSYVSNNNATCTEDGTETAKCDRCEATDTRTDADSKLGHSFTNYISNNDATCLEDGTKTAVCDRCDETNTVADLDSQLGHSFTVYVSNNNATCTEDGTETAKCDRCEATDTRTDADSKLGHSFTNYISNNDATCLEDGTKTAVCDRCDETNTVADLDSQLGHSFTVYVSNNNATCTEDGTETAKCDRCDAIDTRTEVGSAKGHNYKTKLTAPTCAAKGYTTHTCACGDSYVDSYVNALGHSFTNYASNNDATYDSDGTKTAKCDRCDATDTVTDEGSKLIRNGWLMESGKWYFYENGEKAVSCWKADSKGWVYLGANGAMLTNTWCTDSKGWCYVGADGYAVTNCWKRDSYGWIWLDSEGSMTKNAWIKDGGKWYFLDENGYMASNQWRKDSKGWCWLTASGAMATNQWVQDSKGWCYIGADGYCWTNTWAKDSYGWLWLDGAGSMVYNQWIFDGGKWYYVGSNGYMVSNTTQLLGGKAYYFNASGVCTNP